ncbi:MAG: phosphate ABC transporter permease PstA [Chloroflexi bacterium]|nr:phosphate ABC transporter permease PstA [Chloroflexota bacterium]
MATEFNSKRSVPGRNLRYRRLRDRFFLLLFFSSVLFGIAALAVLITDVLIDGLPFLSLDFLTHYPSRHPGESGIKAGLFGTLWVVGLTAAFTIPIGVGAAIYLEEFAGDSWFKRIIQLNIGNLAGVPSIIYGLLGFAVFVSAFGLGRVVLAGALTMTLLALPIVIIASQEAIKAVPDSFRAGGFALGATRWQVVKTIVLPQAIPGIMSGIILAMSRAIGESAPMIAISALVYLTFVPTSPLGRFTVMPIQIFNWAAQPQDEFRQVAATGIIVLLVVLLTMNAGAIYIRNKFQKRRD